jgi:hypothetical protein
MIQMVTDISNNIFQNLLSILIVALLYISKLGMWIGIMMITEKASKTTLYKERRWNGIAISKGVGLILISLILYMLVV